MKLTRDSSILAVATHPDDVKNYTGVMLRSISLGGQVAVVLVTNGENSGGSATREQALAMGEQRKEEVLQFLSSFGIDPGDIFLLGIPNTQSRVLCAIRDDFYRAEGWPYYDSTLGTDRVIYEDAYRQRLPFFGESVVSVLKELVIRTHPTHVITHHQKDDHFEHRSVAFLTRKAVAEAVDEGAFQQGPGMYASLVYHKRLDWPPKGDTFMTEQLEASPFGSNAVLFDLTKEEFERKAEACMIFVPTLSETYIRSYIKKDEIFWRVLWK